MFYPCTLSILIYYLKRVFFPRFPLSVNTHILYSLKDAGLDYLNGLTLVVNISRLNIASC